MAVLPIRVFPDPFLKQATRLIDQLSPQVLRLIEDLTETMRHHPRCVGLAAPQVGRELRLAVVDVTGHPTARGGHGLLVLVNPQVVGRGGRVIQREGCLSIPDLTGNTERASRVQVRARDTGGRQWLRWFEGFEAIAIQHEVDHLDGTLFLDRVANLKTDVFRRRRYWFPEGSSGRAA